MGCGSDETGTSAGTPSGATSGSGFPQSIYPAPIAPEHKGAASSCPNPYGVERLRARSATGAEAALKSINGNRANDMHYVDPALWSNLPGDPFFRGSGAAYGVVDSRRAGPFIVAVHSCGREILRRSWAITIGPTRGPSRNSASLPTTYYVLQRHGHWLLWFLY